MHTMPFLDVTLISAEDLCINRRLIKKNAFATVETVPNNAQSTSMDRDGGSYPSWYQKFVVPLPCNTKHLRVEVKCKTAASVRTIGSVNIPVNDFLEDYIPPDCLHFLSYRLRERNGEPNGIINLSVQMMGLDYVDRPSHLPTLQPA